MSTFKSESRHDFVAKLRQPSVLPRLMDYVEWQKAIRIARTEGKALPKTPRALFPISINLDTTTACSYNCGHCIDLAILNQKIKYEHEKLIASLEHMIGTGLRSVILIDGGEPTLYPKFRDIICFLKNRDVQVAIVSNGAHNNIIHDVAPLLKESDWVRLSLDSGTNDTFIRMHRPRKKSITLGGICSWVPRIRKSNPKLSIGFSYIIVWESAESKAGENIISNIDKIVTATKLARAHHFSYIALKPFLTRYPNGAEVM